MQSTLLMRIANTVMANYDNTEKVGLFDGKMGLCLFFYNCSRYTGCEYYAKTASVLLDEVFMSLNPSMSPSVTDGVAGIGCGIVSLLHDGFVEPEGEDILGHVDAVLLRDMPDKFLIEDNYPAPLFSPGIYLSYRLRFYPEGLDVGCADDLISLVKDNLEKCHDSNTALHLSFINSIVFVCNMLCATDSSFTAKTGEIRHLCDLGMEQSVSNKRDRYCDLVTFEKLNPDNRYGIVLNEKKRVEGNINALDLWYDYGWWNILYDMSLYKTDTDKYINYVNKKMMDCFYDISNVNQKLAAAGMYFIKNRLPL